MMIDNFFRLYHGTDARFISLPADERRTYIEDCKKVINHLWSVFKEYYETQETVTTILDRHTIHVQQRKIDKYQSLVTSHCGELLWHHLYIDLTLLHGMKDEDPCHKYGHLYLTGNKEEAKRYAVESFAGGRVGRTAYHLIQGAEALDWLGMKIDKDLINPIAKIKQFAIGESKPVVIELSHIDPNFLIFENSCLPEGLTFSSLLRHSSFVYTKDCILNPDDVETKNKGFAKEEG